MYKYYPLVTCIAIVLVMKIYLWILEISVNLIIVGNLAPGSVKSVKYRYAIIKTINVSHYFMHRYIRFLSDLNA